MQLTHPTAPVTKPFTISIYEAPNAEANARTRIDEVATKHGVAIDEVKSTGFVFETVTPQADVSGTVAGAPSAVESALQSLALLDAEL